MSISLFKYLSQPHVYLENLRNIATVVGSLLIPVAITLSSRSRERKRATLDLLRRFTTDKVITDKLARLYRYRQFRENVEGATNPFPDNIELIVESVLLLNLCDTIAIEVDAGLVERTMLYKAMGPTLIGAKRVIMKRLQDEMQMDIGSSYKNLDALVEKAERYLQKHDERFVTQIPVPKNR